MPTTDVEVRDVIATYADAFQSLDVDRIVALYADDVRIFDLMGGFGLRGLPAWRAMLESVARDMHEGVCTVADLEVLASDDLAVASATVYYGDKTEAGVEGIHNRATFVLRPMEGTWKIVHEHTSVPLDDKMEPIFSPGQASVPQMIPEA